MKIEEIYPLISEKTKCIIKRNIPFKSGKLLFFDYGEYSHVKTKGDCYIIFVKKDKTSNKLEIALLHEFFIVYNMKKIFLVFQELMELMINLPMNYLRMF